MRELATFLLAALLAVAAESAEPPRIPLTNQVVRYERQSRVFQSTQIPRQHGDALLAALDGGRAVERWMKDGFPPGVACALPVPEHFRMSVTLTNGTNYDIGLSIDGGLLYLPEGLYQPTGAAREVIGRVMSQLEDGLRREVLSASKPCVYTIGTVDDGYTLSGVARLFYGDASKWPQIYEANRKVLKSPHLIKGGERLTIPKL